MTSGGNNFDYFSANQLAKFSVNAVVTTYQLHVWFIKILLVNATEMQEISVTQQVNGKWLQKVLSLS